LLEIPTILTILYLLKPAICADYFIAIKKLNLTLTKSPSGRIWGSTAEYFMVMKAQRLNIAILLVDI